MKEPLTYFLERVAASLNCVDYSEKQGSEGVNEFCFVTLG